MAEWVGQCVGKRVHLMAMDPSYCLWVAWILCVSDGGSSISVLKVLL